MENFPISGSTLESAHIAALARIKKSAALANAELGVLDEDIANAIAGAASEVVTGKYDAQVPISRLPDQLGHLLQHEHEQVLADLATQALRLPRAPQRPRELLAVLE